MAALFCVLFYLAWLPACLAEDCSGQLKSEFFTWTEACFGTGINTLTLASAYARQNFRATCGSSTDSCDTQNRTQACKTAAENLVAETCWGIQYASLLSSAEIWTKALRWSGVENSAVGCSFDDVGTADNESSFSLGCSANGGRIVYNYPGLRRHNLSFTVQANGNCATASIDFTAAPINISIWYGYGNFNVWLDDSKLFCSENGPTTCTAESANKQAPFVKEVTPPVVIKLEPSGSQTYVGEVSWMLTCPRPDPAPVATTSQGTMTKGMTLLLMIFVAIVAAP